MPGNSSCRARKPVRTRLEETSSLRPLQRVTTKWKPAMAANIVPWVRPCMTGVLVATVASSGLKAASSTDAVKSVNPAIPASSRSL